MNAEEARTYLLAKAEETNTLGEAILVLLARNQELEECRAELILRLDSFSNQAKRPQMSIRQARNAHEESAVRLFLADQHWLDLSEETLQRFKLDPAQRKESPGAQYVEAALKLWASRDQLAYVLLHGQRLEEPQA